MCSQIRETYLLCALCLVSLMGSLWRVPECSLGLSATFSLRIKSRSPLFCPLLRNELVTIVVSPHCATTNMKSGKEGYLEKSSRNRFLYALCLMGQLELWFVGCLFPWHVRIQEEGNNQQPRQKPSAGTLILDVPASRDMRNKFLLC